MNGMRYAAREASDFLRSLNATPRSLSLPVRPTHPNAGIPIRMMGRVEDSVLSPVARFGEQARVSDLHIKIDDGPRWMPDVKGTPEGADLGEGGVSLEEKLIQGSG